MARLDPASFPRIPASTQFGAVAYLRWRLFANAFRRKGGAGELGARIMVYPVAFVLLLGPVTGSAFGSYFAVSQGRADLLSLIFWAITTLQMVVSINLSPAGQSFEPESLIRFPLSFPRYLTIRLFLGLLSPSTVAGSLSLLAAATGASIARPDLAPVVFAAALALAVTNMLFVRMVFAWVDRWLSTRRAREIFTGVMILFSIGIQYINVTFNNIGHHGTRAAQAAKIAAVARFYDHTQPLLSRLPPGLAGAAVMQQSVQAPTLAMVQVAGILLFGALFFAVFAWRMEREYRGENLSEGRAAATATVPALPVDAQRARSRGSARSADGRGGSGLSPVLMANLQKEFLYLRRNIAQFYGFLGPLAMVFLFAGRLGNFRSTGLVLPGAVCYCFLGIAALSYNVLGLDGAGVQAYFLAPIRMRSVFLAKNLFGFVLAALQVLLIFIVVFFVAGPPPLPLALATVSWVLFATFINAAVGNIRSVTAPKKMDPNKLSRRQGSQLSGLLSLGIILLAGAVGAGLVVLSRYLAMPWLPLPIPLALAGGAIGFYLSGLNRIDALVYAHRESLIEELCKAS